MKDNLFYFQNNKKLWLRMAAVFIFSLFVNDMLAQPKNVKVVRFYVVDDIRESIFFDFFILSDSNIIDGDYLQLSNSACEEYDLWYDEQMNNIVFSNYLTISKELESQTINSLSIEIIDDCKYEFFVQELSFESSKLEILDCTTERISPISGLKKNKTLNVLGSIEFSAPTEEGLILPISFYQNITNKLCDFMNCESVGAYGVK